MQKYVQCDIRFIEWQLNKNVYSYFVQKGHKEITKRRPLGGRKTNGGMKGKLFIAIFLTFS